jgi:hypothetical protein
MRKHTKSYAGCVCVQDRVLGDHKTGERFVVKQKN